MQIYDHVNIDKEQAARYLELRKKDASITWDDIINKGLVACEAMSSQDRYRRRRRRHDSRTH